MVVVGVVGKKVVVEGKEIRGRVRLVVPDMVVGVVVVGVEIGRNYIIVVEERRRT